MALLVFKTSVPHYAGGGFDSHPLPPNIMPTQEHVIRRCRRDDCPSRRCADGQTTELEDTLVVEEPLEIRLGSERFTVTMRTPGHDFALTRGLLLTEGVISSEADIGQIRYCDTGEAADTDIPNIVTVQLQTAAGRRAALAADTDGGDKLRSVRQGGFGSGRDADLPAAI